jgi:hypothetical protein
MGGLFGSGSKGSKKSAPASVKTADTKRGDVAQQKAKAQTQQDAQLQTGDSATGKQTLGVGVTQKMGAGY